MSTDSKPQQYEPFFHYTSGRWLWDEEKQFRKRYMKFNVEELQRIAAESIGAKSCVSMIKLAEGGYNKVFRLVMDNSSVAIARIPCTNAGPAFKTTASEVATMEFARTILNIQVPKVYAWSAVTDNPVQAEYIVMEEAPGIPLANVWGDMGLQSKDKVIEDLVDIEKKLLSVGFFPGCKKAEVSSEVSIELKREVEERFTIGPVVDHVFWRRERVSMSIERGPWKTAYDYIKALANNQIKWLSHYTKRKTPTDIFQTSNAQNSPDVHIALYKKYLDISPYIFPKDERMTRSTLWHWDMHAPNFFVKDDRITSLIDWQSTWTGPLFLQYRYPKLVNYTGDVMLRLPEGYRDMEKSEKDRVANQVERSLVQYLYETETKKQNPLLVEINDIFQGTTRRQTIEFAEDTWEGDILPFRQCLIRLERHWDEMGYDVPCPIHFTEEDIQNHMRDGEGWNEQADFWDRLEGFVARDGWTSNETFKEAHEMFAGLREEGLKQMTGEERKDFEKRTRWAKRNDN
ncbi:phosphotransferase enzyme family protein [Tricladium varicosporioides]|nr:phosphotransferase enzyme family protein [Hymenoscyphus varicosporioides]